MARTYLNLDQTMLFLAVANVLDPHGFRERLATDPILRRALPVIAGERFFD